LDQVIEESERQKGKTDDSGFSEELDIVVVGLVNERLGVFRGLIL